MTSLAVNATLDVVTRTDGHPGVRLHARGTGGRLAVIDLDPRTAMTLVDAVAMLAETWTLDPKDLP